MLPINCQRAFHPDATPHIALNPLGWKTANYSVRCGGRNNVIQRSAVGSNNINVASNPVTSGRHQFQ